MSDYVCEPLGKHHERSQFNCGVSVLDDYLAKYASQDVKRKAAAVFVLVEHATPKCVIGYYTLWATSVELCRLPAVLTKRLPHYPEIPAILIGRLARDVGFPEVRALLLSDALGRCVRVASEIDCG